MTNLRHEICSRINDKIVDCGGKPIGLGMANNDAFSIIDEELGNLIDFIKKNGDWNLYRITRENKKEKALNEHL